MQQATSSAPTSPAPTAIATTDPKRRYLCRHVFTEGHRCGSPALRGQSLCYNHNRSRRDAAMSGKSGTFPMPRIDDRASIQLALYEVLSRLSGGDIEYKRGSILLYGLQIASSNLPHRAKSDAEQHPQVEEITSDYDLGDLAPITEIPCSQQELEASLVELQSTNPDRAKVKKWLASFPHPQPESLDASLTLAAVHATARLQLLTDIVTPTDTDIPTDVVIPTEVVILSAAKNPRIQPEAPQTSEDTQPLAAQMSTPARNRHSATISPLHTVPSPQPITLAAVQAAAAQSPKPRTSYLEPRTSYQPRTFLASPTRPPAPNALQ